MPAETKTKAIVLGSVRLGESDLLVSFLTEETGLLRAVAKGALKSKKRFQGAFEPFNEVRLSVTVKESGGLGRVNSADVSDPRIGIREALGRIAAGAAMLELVSLLAVPGENPGDLFPLTGTALGLLEGASDPAALCLAFVVKALAIGGYGVPHGRGGGRKVSAGTLAFIGRAEEMEADKMGRLRLSASGAAEALALIRAYAEEMLGKRLGRLEKLAQYSNKS